MRKFPHEVGQLDAVRGKIILGSSNESHAILDFSTVFVFESLVLLEDVGPIDLPFNQELRAQADQSEDSNKSNLELRSDYLLRSGLAVPSTAWLSRLWTRQEAQYASSISFHAVGQPHLVNPMIPRDIEIKPFGGMLQLASSISRANLALMEDLVDEMIRGSGRQINNLDGHARQLAGGIKMAMNELRAVKRVCTKEIDHIMALMPTFPWYTIPTSLVRDDLLQVVVLLEDALRQSRLKDGQCVLSSIVDRAASFSLPLDRPNLTTFDV